AAKTARMGLPEVKLGIIPGYGGTQRLPRLVGAVRALELILSGEPIDAHKALEWGLINRVAESAEETLPAALDLLDPIMKRAPLAVAAAIEAYRRGREVPTTEAMRIEADLFSVLTTTRDMHEGMAAFLEKRIAHFEGR
ncbi:enoyl-CoA hydratase/isomerase family protein, partial [Planctomycetota bacterium]